ncbi:MAG: FAD-binding protein, partial [Promethearchaeota archaeon]
MKFDEFELIYKNDRKEIKNKAKLESELTEILGNQNVSSESIDIFAYSKDSTLIAFNWTLQGKIMSLPDIITWPETVEQISEILKYANKEKIPVIPYAEGSGVVGGA